MWITGLNLERVSEAALRCARFTHSLSACDTHTPWQQHTTTTERQARGGAMPPVRPTIRVLSRGEHPYRQFGTGVRGREKSSLRFLDPLPLDSCRGTLMTLCVCVHHQEGGEVDGVNSPATGRSRAGGRSTSVTGRPARRHHKTTTPATDGRPGTVARPPT